MSNEIQRRDDARAVIEKPVLAVLRKNKAVIETIAKGVLTEDRVFRLINAALTRTPDLLECSPLSVLNAIVHATYLGLEIGPEMAYLIPFNDKKGGGKKTCTLIIDYRGKIRIAANADIIFDDPEIVYAGDKFRRWTDENGKHFLHEPLEKGNRGDPTGAYVVSRWNGIPKVTYMTAEEIEFIRSKSRNGTSGPWIDWPLRMWCKTVVHRAFKTLPRPTNHEQAEKVRRSQEIDEKFEMAEPLEAIVEGSFEDEQPMLAAGSAEDQAKVAENKIKDLQGSSVTKQQTERAAPETSSASSEPASTSYDMAERYEQQVAENREKAKQADERAAQETPAADKPQFGSKPKFGKR